MPRDPAPTPRKVHHHPSQPAAGRAQSGGSARWSRASNPRAGDSRPLHSTAPGPGRLTPSAPLRARATTPPTPPTKRAELPAGGTPGAASPSPGRDRWAPAPRGSASGQRAATSALVAENFWLGGYRGPGAEGGFSAAPGIPVRSTREVRREQRGGSGERRPRVAGASPGVPAPPAPTHACRRVLERCIFTFPRMRNEIPEDTGLLCPFCLKRDAFSITGAARALVKTPKQCRRIRS